MSDIKKENGFVKLDNGKPKFDFCAGLLSTLGSNLGVEGVLQYGATKYERDNWKLGGSSEDIRRNVNAAIRHLGQFLDGLEYDAESGLPHLAHAAADVLFALYHHLPRETSSHGKREEEIPYSGRNTLHTTRRDPCQ